MTPAPQPHARAHGITGDIIRAAVGAALLAAFFLPARDPATNGFAVEWRPSAEVAGVLFLVAVAALARPRLVTERGASIGPALLVVVAAVLNLADALTPILLGRDLNLYWDLRHLPSLVGLASGSAGLWTVSVAAAALLALILLAIGSAYWIWRKVLFAFTDRRISVGALVFLGMAFSITAFAPAEWHPLATGLGVDLIRHAAVLDRSWRGGAETPGALVTPGPPVSDLTGLKHRDVYLVYIESYGTTVFDTPEFRRSLQESLAQFEAALRGSGYTIASNRLISPTFGGGSWFAHATMASGVRVDDPVLYSQLLGSGRKLLPGYFKAAGWRAIDIMPGTKVPAPEARAWDFDREVYAAELGYRGPSFGWFAIPDQFTLDRASAIRAALDPEPPVFTQIVLVSSHIPFSPVPPFLADWGDSGAFATVPPSAWDEIFRQSDWRVLAPGYLKSLQYDFAVLGDWLAKFVSGNGLVILLGDHQPPAVVGGEFREWTVPIHVLSRDPALVAPFIAAGYVPGLDPTQMPPHQGMEKFLPSFLAAFDRAG